MAWGSSNINANKLTLQAADKPIFLASNEIVGAADYRWVRGAYSTVNDHTDGSYPDVRAYDGFGHVDTRATFSGSLNTYQWVIDNFSGTFDTIALICNPGTATGTITVSVQVSDDNSFTDPSANLYELFNDNTLSVGTNRRVFYDMAYGGSNDQVVTGSGWAKVNFVTTGVFTVEPYLFEAFFCQRHQLTKNPDVPFNPQPIGASAGAHVADSRARQKIVRASGFKDFNASWTYTATGLLDDESTFQNLFDDTTYGADSFFFVYEPNTSPHDAHLVTLPPGTTYHDAAFSGPFARHINLQMQEMPPFVGWSV